ncbi:MAG TPA: permease-like cell division protein FtsX [Acidimicrobiales bacterium]|jgi:cell division transport system permease protein|nr:permease-like cell division protein FtsX [Acidimicrobiales bacterium]
MALKVDYVARETLTNLKRNLTLTVASILTVAVSLALVGSAFVVQKAVAHSTKRWKGDVQFIVFMKADASQAQIDAVGRQLNANPKVAKVTYFDKKQAYAEYKDLFRNDPVFIDVITEKDVPTSYRVKPKGLQADAIQAMGNSYANAPGVYKVTFALDAVKTVERVSGVLSSVILGTAVFLLLAASMLILNTIRMAMFARRREIEVMKLVGATNWFIRVPFMVEGLIQGLLGAVPAIISVITLHLLLDNASRDSSSNNIFTGLVVTGGQTTGICFLLAVIGAAVGAVGSLVAVTRFLDV